MGVGGAAINMLIDSKFKEEEYNMTKILFRIQKEYIFQIKKNQKQSQMGSSKGNWGRYGLQEFGISVLGPLLFYLINLIIEHFKGNRDAVAYTQTYVNQWDSIKFILPNDLLEQSIKEGSSHIKIIAVW